MRSSHHGADIRPTARAGEITYRAPVRADAGRLRGLVGACPPLDVNSTYAYLLLCTHFASTCAVAEAEGAPIGFASGYLEPDDPSVLFIWQIAVSARARRLGVGRRLLHEILARPACQHVRYLEATIAPSNQASWDLFRRFARDRRADCRRTPLFGAEEFGGEYHEAEELLRVGPMTGRGVTP